MDDYHRYIQLLVGTALVVIIRIPLLLTWGPSKTPTTAIQDKITAAAETEDVAAVAQKALHQAQESTEWFEALKQLSLWARTEGAPILICVGAFVVGLVMPIVDMYRYSQDKSYFSEGFVHYFFASVIISSFPMVAYRVTKNTFFRFRWIMRRIIT